MAMVVTFQDVGRHPRRGTWTSTKPIAAISSGAG
jgi:hypothetical protein